MPRPYHWIRGEGTTKNQRWGLGSLMDTPFIPRLGFSGLGQSGGTCPGTPGCPGYVAPDSQEYYDSINAELANLYDEYRALVEQVSTQQAAAGEGPSFSTWAQEHSTLLLVGGIVGLLLFRK